jgi:hypothetical protein
MIFSVWQPDGGYEYFESNQRHGIGDDLPDPVMPAPTNKIGVPAQDIGRPVPTGANFVGKGATPRGVIAPMGRGQVLGLRGLDGTASNYANVIFFIVVGAILWDVYNKSEWSK